MWLIVGLGNPGPKYELTRHNIGFLAVDFLLDKAKAQSKNNFSSEAARFNWLEQDCLCLKPQTFMNKSGLAVQQALSFYKIPLDNLIVIHDELDLPLGEMRIKKGGSDGGHNGLKDITSRLGPNYLRIRLGIGRPTHKGSEADYVLSPFSDQELKLVEQILPKSLEALPTLMTHGLAKAQAEHQIKAPKNSNLAS